MVIERDLRSLLARGRHPRTGEQLGRAWRADGVTGYDLTFSAPKSVSAAVSRKALTGLFRFAPRGFAAAVFDHRTSWAGDPQLHSHALVWSRSVKSLGVTTFRWTTGK